MSTTQGLGIAVLVLGIIAVVFGLIVLSMLVRQRSSRVMSIAIGDALEQVKQDTRHYVAVNAVLGLTERFTQNQELVQRLAEYSDQVVAAALTYRLNSLGEQYQTIMGHLEKLRDQQGAHGKIYDDAVDHLERQAAHVLQQLQEAQAATRELFAVSA